MKMEIAAEALPKNEKTEQIMAQRAAAEEARQLKAEQEKAAKDKEDKARRQREKDAAKV